MAAATFKSCSADESAKFPPIPAAGESTSSESTTDASSTSVTGWQLRGAAARITGRQTADANAAMWASVARWQPEDTLGLCAFATSADADGCDEGKNGIAEAHRSVASWSFLLQVHFNAWCNPKRNAKRAVHAA